MMAGEPTTRMLLYVFTLWERVTSMTQPGEETVRHLLYYTSSQAYKLSQPYQTYQPYKLS